MSWIKITPDGDEFTNICPECIKSDQKSRLYIDTKKRRDINDESEKYYDEKGILHLHTNLTYDGTWHCSNGHKSSYVETRVCRSCK